MLPIPGPINQASHTAYHYSGPVTIAPVTHGRGIIASADIAAGTLIAVCPALILPRNDLQSEFLAAYVFEWPAIDNRAQWALLGGIGSFFNHADQPSATFEADLAHSSIRFTSCRNINAGEEICIDYDYAPEHIEAHASCAWFATRK